MSRDVQQRVQCHIFDLSRLLLGETTDRVDYFEGMLASPDGFAFTNEGLTMAIKRVCENDLGITPIPEKTELVVRKFYRRNDLEYDVQVDVFLVTGYEGLPMNTNRLANIKWYEIGNLPLDKMSPDDRDWIVSVIRNGERFDIVFDSNGPTNHHLISKVNLVRVASHVPTPA